MDRATRTIALALALVVAASSFAIGTSSKFAAYAATRSAATTVAASSSPATPGDAVFPTTSKREHFLIEEYEGEVVSWIANVFESNGVPAEGPPYTTARERAQRLVDDFPLLVAHGWCERHAGYAVGRRIMHEAGLFEVALD